MDWIFISFLIAQRIAELIVAKRHERTLKGLGAIQIDKRGYKFIVGMHVAFFISLVLEKLIFNRPVSPEWRILIVIFLAAQFLRYWAIVSLGVYWNTKVLVLPTHPMLRKGPYRILRHPNYVAVVTELAVIPLILSCYVTAATFTIINAFVIRRRIRIEVRALAKANS